MEGPDAEILNHIEHWKEKYEDINKQIEKAIRQTKVRERTEELTVLSEELEATNKELQDQLYAKYPTLYKDKNLSKLSEFETPFNFEKV